jgi:hypothetical protein
VIDVLGQQLFVGARVACAFSYSHASVGYLRIGIIKSMDDESSIVVNWEYTDTVSPKMKYGNEFRWVIL